MKKVYLYLCLILLSFCHCTSDDGNNFEVVTPEGFTELNINVRQWTSATTWEKRGGAIVRIYETEADRSSLQNETHTNNSDTLGNCVFQQVKKSQLTYLHSQLLDGNIKLEEIELDDSDIQNLIIMHDL